jgi:hypothetical protein
MASMNSQMPVITNGQMQNVKMNEPKYLVNVGMEKQPEVNINKLLMTDKLVFDTINKQVLQKTPNADDSLIAEYDYYQDPAFRTITANLTDKSHLGKNTLFIDQSDLENIQTNVNPNEDSNQPIQAFNTQTLNIQGLPMGFDKGVGGSNPELASINSP